MEMKRGNTLNSENEIPDYIRQENLSMRTLVWGSRKDIVVPDGMVKAAYEYCPGSFARPAVIEMLKGALHWLAENPIAPSYEQAKELWRTSGGAAETNEAKAVAIYVTEWQRGMFLAKDTKAAEALSVAQVDARIPDLLFDTPTDVRIDAANDAIREAYRRGMEASKSKVSCVRCDQEAVYNIVGTPLCEDHQQMIRMERARSGYTGPVMDYEAMGDPRAVKAWPNK